MSILLKKIVISKWHSSLKSRHHNNINEQDLLVVSSCNLCHSYTKKKFYLNQIDYLEKENDIIDDLLYDIETFYKPFIT